MKGAIVVDVAKHIARESLGAAEADWTSRKIGYVGVAKTPKDSTKVKERRGTTNNMNRNGGW